MEREEIDRERESENSDAYCDLMSPSAVCEVPAYSLVCASVVYYHVVMLCSIPEQAIVHCFLRLRAYRLFDNCMSENLL